MGEKIDIIVPCYKAHKVLPRLLGSIICQDIVDDLSVTLVNDGDENDYQELVSQFSKFVEIKEVKLEKNSGPGTARRFGYENTSNPLVTWIDADDTFSGAFALKLLRHRLLQEPVNVICIGTFVEEHSNKQPEPVYVPHQNDTVWMFGKLYKRSFLDQYNIRMNDTRANEDNGFNMLCKLMCNERQQIKFIPDVVYFWHENENSITRINNCQYSYDQSFVGYTENMIWAIKEAEKRNPFNGAILYEKIATLMNLYEYFMETEVRDKRFVEQNWNSCKLYYKEIYKEIKDKIPEAAFTEAYNNVMRNSYMGNKLVGIIPSMSIHEFINKLDEETKTKKKNNVGGTDELCKTC